MLKMRLITMAFAAALMLPALAEETETGEGGRGEGRGNCPHFVDADGDGVCDSFVDADGDGVCDRRASGERRFRRSGPRDGSGRGAALRERRAACDCQGEEDCECPQLRRGRGSRDGEGRASGRRWGEAARDGSGRGEGPKDGTGYGPRRGKRLGPQDQSGPGCNE